MNENEKRDKMCARYFLEGSIQDYGDLTNFPHCKSNKAYASMIYNSEMARQIRKLNQQLEKLKAEFGVSDER